MADVAFQITVPSDNDGFITLQCPFCRVFPRKNVEKL
jgi:hypothetical protein